MTVKEKAEEYRKNFNYHQDWHGQVIDKSPSTIVEQAFIDGYHECEKEHEWHYVYDGDFPKENKKYWILTSSGEPKVDSWLSISWVYSYDVIAWKEIVPPKEIKENE